MEERLPCKPVEVSDNFKGHRIDIYEYTFDAFGYYQAERYIEKIDKALNTLQNFYVIYPECRHLTTKSRMYRNIILDAHLIIYRITDKCIKVLDIIHSASSIGKIRDVRKIQY